MIPIKELFLGVQRTFRVPRTTKVVVLTSVCRKDCSFLCSILAYQDMRAAWALASEKAFTSQHFHAVERQTLTSLPFHHIFHFVA